MRRVFAVLLTPALGRPTAWLQGVFAGLGAMVLLKAYRAKTGEGKA